MNHQTFAQNHKLAIQKNQICLSKDIKMRKNQELFYEELLLFSRSADRTKVAFHRWEKLALHALEQSFRHAMPYLFTTTVWSVVFCASFNAPLRIHILDMYVLSKIISNIALPSMYKAVNSNH